MGIKKSHEDNTVGERANKAQCSLSEFRIAATGA